MALSAGRGRPERGGRRKRPRKKTLVMTAPPRSPAGGPVRRCAGERGRPPPTPFSPAPGSLPPPRGLRAPAPPRGLRAPAPREEAAGELGDAEEGSSEAMTQGHNLLLVEMHPGGCLPSRTAHRNEGCLSIPDDSDLIRRGGVEFLCTFSPVFPFLPMPPIIRRGPSCPSPEPTHGQMERQLVAQGAMRSFVNAAGLRGLRGGRPNQNLSVIGIWEFFCARHGG